jgi:hypothetical protein
VDGEATPPDNGDIALNGFERPCELSGPNRFDGRGSSTRAPPSLASAPDVDRDNLEELLSKENTHFVSCNDHLGWRRGIHDELCPAGPQVCIIHRGG